MSDEIASGGALVKYVLLAKNSKGKACVALIQQALNAPQCFVFGELLETPTVKALAEGADKIWFDTLALFAYGTFAQYKENPRLYAELTPPLVKKLKQLSLASIAAVQKSIPYPVLLRELSLDNVRELEDLIIDCIYANIIKGKLDQHEQIFHVDWAMGRDIRPGQIDEMIKVLNLWSEKSETLMKSIQEKVQLATFLHDQHQKQQKEFDMRVDEIKANLKAAMEADMAVEFEGGIAGFEGANKKSGRKNKGGAGGADRRRR